jgi:calcium channel MID1
MNLLAAFYDNNTSNYFQFFANALAQIPCNTTSSAQYSLARTCDDCVSAYKTWLCAVAIPRCTDFSSDLPWLQPRSMVNPFPNGTTLPDSIVDPVRLSLALNSSRNPLIDQDVQPGPYKEILPCDDLCYDIVQSCPSSMGFGCPRPSRTGFNASYGTRSPNGELSCNFPGAEFYPALSAGSGPATPHLWMIVSLVVMILGVV